MLSVQIRFGNGMRRRFQVPDAQRGQALRRLAAELVARKVEPGAAAQTLTTAATATAIEFAQIRDLVLRTKAPKGPVKPRVPTFREVAEQWTSGELHRRFPDQVTPVQHSVANAGRLENLVFPVIGSLPITAVTRAECDDVMRRLPEGLARSTRRQYAALILRVLNLACLAGYIAAVPLPRGWLPRSGAKTRFPILYPGEDRTLLACSAVPLCHRMLYGFLLREGMRRGEAARLRWTDLDLDLGTVRLDVNKTDHARWWKLGEGVCEALRAWRAHPDASPDLVFASVDFEHLAAATRRHLKAAGLTRPDLYSTGPQKRAFGSHCFRRSFVTLHLASGATEDFVRQRTGHKSLELLGYRQGANAAAELSLGLPARLDLAIPELAALRPPPKGGTVPGTAPEERTPRMLLSVENDSRIRNALNLAAQSSCISRTGGAPSNAEIGARSSLTPVS